MNPPQVYMCSPSWTLPGGLVVKIPHSQHRGTGSIPGQRTKVLHATWWGQEKKKLVTDTWPCWRVPKLSPTHLHGLLFAPGISLHGNHLSLIWMYQAHSASGLCTCCSLCLDCSPHRYSFVIYSERASWATKPKPAPYCWFQLHSATWLLHSTQH